MLTTISPSTFSLSTTESDYDYYLAVSSDTLVIVNKQHELVEFIIHGSDSNGLLCSAPDEDTFLEALLVIKNVILSGRNPLEVIEDFKYGTT